MKKFIPVRTPFLEIQREFSPSFGDIVVFLIVIVVLAFVARENKKLWTYRHKKN